MKSRIPAARAYWLRRGYTDRQRTRLEVALDWLFWIMVAIILGLAGNAVCYFVGP